jgi:hypothetical protein
MLPRKTEREMAASRRLVATSATRRRPEEAVETTAEELELELEDEGDSELSDVEILDSEEDELENDDYEDPFIASEDEEESRPTKRSRGKGRPGCFAKGTAGLFRKRDGRRTLFAKTPGLPGACWRTRQRPSRRGLVPGAAGEGRARRERGGRAVDKRGADFQASRRGG